MGGGFWRGMGDAKDKKKGPLVSVVIPTFNRGYIISRAIESVLNQSYTNWELIIVDDGSTDDTKDIIKSYLKDKRVKYFYQKNAGVSAARNLAIKKARGEYIAFLDSDDEFLSNKLGVQLRSMRLKKAELSICGEYQIFENSKVIKSHVPKLSSLSYEKFITHSITHSASLIIIKKESNIFFNEDMPAIEDTDFVLRFLKRGNVIVTPDVLVRRYKNLNENRLSCNNKSKIKGHKKVLKNIKEEEYAMDKDLEILFCQKIYFNLGLFHLLDKNYKKGRFYLKKVFKDDLPKSIVSFSFLLYSLSFIQPILKMSFCLARLFWRMGLMKGGV